LEWHTKDLKPEIRRRQVSILNATYKALLT
jgi:hypothetical protein